MNDLIPQFKNKRDLFDYLHKNKSEIIDKRMWNKKEFVFTPCEVTSVIKSATSTTKDFIQDGVISKTIIGNTYYWLDSHDDVHDKGIFTKSTKENKNKIRFTHDHEQKLTARIGTFTDVYEKEVKWKDLGVNKEGYTICLLGDGLIEKQRNESIYNAYLNNEIDQHSVEMYYLKMDLALNDKDYKEEYKQWNAIFPLLGNPQKAIERGFFFVQKEAKLKAISCVVEASNEITGIYEPSKDTHFNIEPAKAATHDFSKIKFITI